MKEYSRDYWVERARHCRAFAAAQPNEAVHARMLGFARNYDALAEAAQPGAGDMTYEAETVPMPVGSCEATATPSRSIGIGDALLRGRTTAPQPERCSRAPAQRHSGHRQNTETKGESHGRT